MLFLQTIFLSSCLLFLAFRAIFGIAFFRHKSTTKAIAKNPVLPLSWIICARNELENLKKNVPEWLRQKHPSWELIIVLDRCSDDSKNWLLENFSSVENLKIVENKKEDLPGKRNALVTGAENAQSEYILLSDADCQPASQNWLATMAQHFEEKTDFVIGFSPYYRKPGFLNLFVRFETFLTAMLYGSASLLGNPYMGVGRNLGIRKKYLQRKYFSRAKSLSGDDDLLINQFAKPHNTKVCLSKEALIYSNPKENWKAYVSQKQRHSGAGHFYKMKDRIFLAMYYAVHILFYLSGFAICLFFAVNIHLIVIFLSALLINSFILCYLNKKLKFGLRLPELLIGDFCVSFFLFSLGILSVKQVRKW